MSTAEITFSVGELAHERRQEARKILWALLAALVIHLIVGFLLAIVSSVQSTPISEGEDDPVELTIVDMSPVEPAKPKNAQFIETDESKASPDAPKEKTFESNANSIGASEAAPSGNLPLPSQDGREDRKAIELDNQSYSPTNRGAPAQPAAAQPSVAPQATAPPEPSAAPSQGPSAAPTAAPDQFAMLTTRPTPATQPQTATPMPAAQSTPVPQQPSSAYQAERQKTKIGGNISNRGASRVNATGTPLGRYQKIVSDAIGARWYAYTRSKYDMITIGTLSAHFFVDQTGRIKNLKIVSNSSNEAFANVCIQSIMEASLPPIPEDVAATLPSEGLECDGFNFTIYPN